MMMLTRDSKTSTPSRNIFQDYIIIFHFQSNILYLDWQLKLLFQLFLTEIEKTTDFIGDVVFLVDSSLNVSQDNFQKETDFVKAMARLLNVRPSKSRAAVISYGRNSTLVTRFTSYSSTDEFEASVDSAPYEGGLRRIDQAVRNAGRVLGEARRSLPKVVILLTSGPETQDPDTEDLFDAAVALRGFDAKSFVVAIGSSPDVNELLPLVRTPEDVFQVPSFDDLGRRTMPIARRVAGLEF